VCARPMRYQGLDGCRALVGTGDDHEVGVLPGMSVVLQEEGKGAPAGREMDGRRCHRETVIPSLGN
jgi:hypothetical protein